MDIIGIEGIKAYGRHGVLDSEKELGQPFIVDISFGMPLTLAGKTDALSASVSYADIYNIVIDEVQNKRYDLIEKLCYKIIMRTLLFDVRIQEVEVTVKKPHAPLYGMFDYAKVTMKRGRNEIDISELGE